MMVCRGHTRTLNGGEPIWNEIVVGEQLWGRGEGMATGNRGRSQRGEEGDGLSSRKKTHLHCHVFNSYQALVQHLMTCMILTEKGSWLNGKNVQCDCDCSFTLYKQASKLVCLKQ